ncbi:EpsG family protein [Algoriphagus sp.]|uniref:EpsG family protein n=1 Tax=Algoriphagus sp. TaxID=1872435 RepID=UPI002724936F|nr:EpsG family protein [Algoriphagus sp.]MDO8965704.1 EpsG family protein [Algoriphagus sp.]MDP3202397.1 EpsG family protein [Algoriphagus sp.]
MIGALYFNLLSFLIIYFSKSINRLMGLFFSVFCIFIFLAIRYDYGNDYFSYLDQFYEIQRYSSFSISNFIIKGNEIGWVYLNYFFGPLGFFAMQIFLAAFSCFVLYRFIKNYVSPKYYWFAIFIYIFQPYHMLVLSSAMRQAVVVSLFLLAIDFLIKKQSIHYIVVVLLGSLFHSTAYFLLPLVFLSYFSIQLKFKYIVIIVVLFIGSFFFIGEIFSQGQQFISLYFEKEYSGHINQSVEKSTIGLGFILNFIIYIILFYCTQHQNYLGKVIFLNIVVISFLIIPLTFSFPLISRLNFYFTPLLMVAYPIAFENIQKRTIRIGFIILISISTLYEFFSFFYSETWINHFFEYKTIFSAPNFL